MVRDDPRAWAWVPIILNRIALFCRTMDTDTWPDEAVELTRYWFATGDPRLGLWVGIQDQERLVGHLLATPEPLGSKEARYVLIRQAQVDPGLDSRKAARETFQQVLDWTKAQGLTQLTMVTHRSAVSMARRWEFQQQKVIMRRTV